MSGSFSANYRRYTPEMTLALARISTALGTIRGARLFPAAADQLRSSARVGTIHYSNLIEGNQLSVLAAERAARRTLEPDSRAKIELINYVAALDLLDERLAQNELVIDVAFIKELHGVLTRGLGREDDDHFKPHHEGDWRDGRAFVVDQIAQQILFEGPPPEEVDEKMHALTDWVAGRLRPDGEPPFVVSGVLHYAVTDIHPFADGNGRMARLLQTAALMTADVLPGRMFSFEQYYAEDRNRYYESLRSVRKRTFNMEWWLHYFLDGMVEEYERVATTVVDLNALAGGGGTEPLRLKASQQTALTALRIQGRREFTRRDYEGAARVGRSAALDDLGALCRHGILLPRGSGPSQRYVFAGTQDGKPKGGRGRPQIWTDQKIEHELRSYLQDKEGWPSPKTFVADERRNLYAAMGREGGIRRWRGIVGR